ncbi:hypothetical protein BP6252_05655 [Coleophoma cylindrospora]|uniref:Uncharacterized protein n=1 Tax=Coleophoma cylindrospora TaxID=1849047 RepID=A0A3D8RU27_9HELO|nr:hypothetical protein BP6252_05655 [Coleophoma cylindrospora]
MATNHAHAPWRKTVLIPFWTLQLLFLLIMLVLLVMVLVLADVAVNELNNDGYNVDGSLTLVKIIDGIWTGLNCVCLGLTITEIVLLARYKLTPRFFLISNVIKSTILTAIFVYDIVTAVTHTSTRKTSAFGFIVDIALLLCFYIPLIYGARIFHRNKHAYIPVEPVLTQDTSYVSGMGAVEMPGRQYGHFASAAPGKRDLEAGSDFGGPIVSSDGREPFRGRILSYNQEQDTTYNAYAPYAAATTPSTGGFSAGPTTPPTYREVPEVIVHQEDGQVFEMDGRKSYR